MAEDQSMGAIDYAVFVGMLLVSTAIGVYYAWIDRNRQSNQEFLMGGKRMGVIPVAMSLMASFMSSITILGYPAEIYTKGTQFWVSVASCFICTAIAAELFLPIFYKMSLTSVNEYLYRRYDSSAVRIIASISYLFASLPYLGIVLFGPSLALGAVTKLSVFWSVILMGVICTFYTSIGGLKAVIWTDVVQFILMFAGMIAVVVKGTIDAGGVSESFRKASLGNRVQFFNMNFDIYSSNTFWTVMIGTITMWSGGFSTSQMQVQRSCSMSNIKKAKASLYISLPGFVLMLSLACYAGVVVFANYYDCDPLRTGQLERPDQLMPYFVLQSFSDHYPGIPGLFVACVFSSSLSTLSSGYNALAAIIWEDFFKLFMPGLSKSGTVWMTRLIAAVIGIASIGLALVVSQVGTIFEAAMALSGAQIGPIFALFVIGVFCPCGNAVGVIVGLLTGQLSCMFITIGAMINKRPLAILPSTTDGCDLTLFANLTRPGLPLQSLANATIPEYSPLGLNAIFHVSPYLVPFFGFIIALAVGLLVSALSGCNAGQHVDPELINVRVSRLFAACMPASVRPDKDKQHNEYALTERVAYSRPLTISEPYIRVSKSETK